MIICADDYGLREDINEAILDLCHLGKLTAVSCMAALNSCTPTLLSRLARYEKSLDIGLHLCLTAEAEPWSPPADEIMAAAPSYRMLLKQTFLDRIDAARFQRQISAQYELFVEKMGRAPDHIDGHLHAHQLPQVRDAVVRFMLSVPQARRPYLRNTAMPIHRHWRHGLPRTKAFWIGLMGKQFENKLNEVRLNTNRGFSGIYDFRHSEKYSSYLPRFMEYLSEKRYGILVVHPGAGEDWRKKEHEVLRNFVFSAPPNRFQQ